MSTFSPSRHARYLSGLTDRLPHSQPHVHDGVKVRIDDLFNLFYILYISKYKQLHMIL